MADQLIITDAQLLSNDEGLGLLVLSVGSAAAGRVERIDGGVLYTAPTTGSSDTFTYRIQDRFGATATATVTVNLIDATIVVARDDVFTTPIDCGISIDFHPDELLNNDTGETALRVTAVSQPVHGTVALSANGVTFTTEDCGTLTIQKTFQVARRRVRSTLDANGYVVAESLTADKENINVMQPGDFAMMSTIRLGSSEMEAGWTLVADSSQAKLFYREIDQAYIDQHNQEQFIREDDPYPYPYIDTYSDNVGLRPEIRIETFVVPPGVPKDDVILMAQANTQTTGEDFYFRPAPVNENYYRNIYIDAYGPAGEDSTDTVQPAMFMSTTYKSSEDNLNDRIAEYVGNRMTYAISGDTLDGLHGGGGTLTFSEDGYVTRVSNVYSTAYALREVPRPDATLEAGFTYTAEDENGSTDTARVTLPVRASINPRVSRIRQSGMFIAENGFVGLGSSQNVGSYSVGIHVKQAESTDFSGPNPIDPFPDQGWTVLAKTPQNQHTAGTMVYRRVETGGQNEIRAFRGMVGLIASASMTGIEIIADEGETWEDIFVAAYATNITLPNAGFPFVAPKHTIPNGCHSLTFITARPWTCLFKISGEDSFDYHYSRRDFVNLMSMIVHSTTVSPHVVMRPLNPDRVDMSASTMTLILRNRK